MHEDEPENEDQQEHADTQHNDSAAAAENQTDVPDLSQPNDPQNAGDGLEGDDTQANAGETLEYPENQLDQRSTEEPGQSDDTDFAAADVNLAEQDEYAEPENNTEEHDGTSPSEEGPFAEDPPEQEHLAPSDDHSSSAEIFEQEEVVITEPNPDTADPGLEENEGNGESLGSRGVCPRF